MGTIIFTTDKDASAILADELCGFGKIRMFTTDHESACAAVVLELANMLPDTMDRIRTIYDVKPTDTRITFAVVWKQSGLKGRGVRSVSLKEMTEEMGPYYTGGATMQLLKTLTPLKAGPASQYAQEWRKRAGLSVVMA